MNSKDIIYIQKNLVSIWRRVLNLEFINADENFFSMGGHSLLAVDLLNEIEENLSVKLNMKDLVEAPTINELSKIILNHKNSSEHEALFDLNQTLFPLTLNQKQVWGLNALYPNSVTHNISTAIRIKRKLDINILTETINVIVARQESLRTRFKVHNGVPKQEIIPEHKFSFSFVDIKEEDLQNTIQKEMKHVFNLETAPLMKIIFYRINEEDYVFFFLFHHIIWDGLSNTFFFHEFISLYKSLSEGKKLELPEIRMSYKQHAINEAAYLKSEDFFEQRESWKDYLKGDLPVLNLPTDFPRPEKINNESGTLYFELDQKLLEQLENYVQVKYISLYNVFFAVYNIMLARMSGNHELIVGTPVHGRHHRDGRKTFGYFINTLPVRTQLEVDKSFKDNLSLFMESLKHSFYNQNIPLDIIIQNSNVENDPGRTPLFQTLFIYLDVTKELDVFKAENLEQVKVDRYSVHTELDFYLYKSREKVEGVIEFRKDLYTKESMAKMGELFVSILRQVVSNESITLKELGLKENLKEQSYIPMDSRAFSDFSQNKSFIRLFEGFAKSQPDKVAVNSQGGKLTYKELNDKASQLAKKLVDMKISTGSFVGVSISRNPNMLISLLAVIKSGAAYVPLDPAFPDERIAYMLECSKASAVIVEKKLSAHINHSNKILVVEVLEETFDGIHIEYDISLDETCYVLFTSGSTGKPKGVEVSHLNVLNFLLSMQKEPGFQSNDKLLSVTTMSFDISVLELFLPLISGGSVYIANENQIINGDELSKVLSEEKITCMQATPSTWRLLLASSWKGSPELKILCGGEAMPKDLAFKLIPFSKELWNMYGPTETTVWSTIKKVSLEDKKILIGSAIDNTILYILDEKMKPCPVGVPGSLYIGGLGVSKGYIRDVEQTNKRFIQSPFRNDERIYNTGDLARFEGSGEVECLGRSDDQVKIRGFRIELGEIENALLLSHKMGECAVKVHGNKIVAYVVSESLLTENQIREKVKKLLPYYMVPNKIIFTNELPKTLNGKIDRNKLTESMGRYSASENCLNADAEIVEDIALIWKNVLGRDQIDYDENFFTIGGHSIAAVEIFGLINDRFQIDLPLAAIFEATTIRELSFIVEKELSKKVLELKNFKCVVGIKASTEKSEPVFCFHGVGGNVLNYYRLAEHVGHRAFYGVQSLGVNGKDQIIECIHEMARIYIEEIKKVQPKGPYILAGGSMGGMVALEAAIQLKKNGDEIKALIMFDTVGPDLDFKTYGEEKVGLFHQLKNSLRFRMEKLINSVKVNFYLLTKVSIPHSVRYFSIEDKNFVALRSYRPQIFEGNIVLIRAPRKSKGYYADPYLGWRNTINGKIETIEIEGDHHNFIESPELSHAFKSVLKRFH